MAGGSDDRDWNGELDLAEIFDPRTHTWSAAPDLSAKRFKLPETAALLSSGDVLIAGGSPRAELYDQVANRFVPVTGTIDTARHYISETRLAGGEVLLAGGYPDSDESTAKSWIVHGYGRTTRLPRRIQVHPHRNRFAISEKIDRDAASGGGLEQRRYGVDVVDRPVVDREQDVASLDARGGRR